MTNEQARGYAVLAARAAGISDAEILDMYEMMPRVFDEYTEQEAESRSDRIIVNIEKKKPLPRVYYRE